MTSSIFSSLFSLFSRTTPPPTHPSTFPYKLTENPYRCKKPWPPDFIQLSQKHQFRLERRYRRRSKLKWARPNWIKAVKLVQWGSILFVCVYGVFYLDVEGVRSGRGDTGIRGGEERKTVFDGVRKWYEGQLSGFRGARERKSTVEDGEKG